jgi:hypothetical protein
MDRLPPRLVRTHTPKDEAFWRRLTLPQEDRALFTSAEWKGGYRWFRATNIVPIEHYRRPVPVPQQKAS